MDKYEKLENTIKSISERIETERMKLDKLIKRRDEILDKHFFLCERERHDYCGTKWDEKNGRFKSVTYVGCGKDVPKNKFFYVGVEEYIINQCGTDCGYGDCDEFRWEHHYSIYRVCGVCGKVDYLEHKRFADCSESWCRCEWDADKIKTIDITPDVWPKDKNGENDKKFYKFDTLDKCRKHFYKLGG